MVDQAGPDTDVRKSAFTVAVWLLLFALIMFGAWWLVFAGWFLEPYAESSGADELAHRVHEVSFGALFTIALIGVLLQLRRPTENIAAMWQALVAIGAVAVAALATSLGDWRALLLLGLVILAAVLHPAGRSLLLPRLAPLGSMIALAVVFAIPMVSVFAREVAKASADAQGHQSHWGMMAALALVLLVLAFVGAFRLPGWEVTAFSVVGAVLLYVAVSQRFPFDASARPGLRSFGLALWAGAYGFVAYRAVLRGSKQRRKLGTARLAMATTAWVFVGLLLVPGLLSFPGGSPANVPHLVPRSELSNYRYCSSCHDDGVGGATIRPHSLSYLGGTRNGCTDCHAVSEEGTTEAAVLPRASFGPAASFDSLDTARLVTVSAGVAGD